MKSLNFYFGTLVVLSLMILSACTESISSDNEVTVENKNPKNIERSNEDLLSLLESIEKYNDQNRIACDIKDAPGIEYDKTWDPVKEKYTGHLKVGKNGKLWQSTTFKKGLKHGEELMYDDNGFLMGITDWKNGKKEGRYYQMDEQGHLLLKALTNNDEIIDCEGPLCP